MNPPKIPPLKIPAGVSRPKGPQSMLIQAVERLAPHQGVWIKDNGRRVTLSKKVAIKTIDRIARRYNTNKYLEARSPRLSSIFKTLKHLKKTSAALAKQLSLMDPMTASIIGTEGLDLARKRPYAAIVDGADLVDLIPTNGKPSRWARRISKLSETADLLHEHLSRSWRRQGSRSVDVGGNRTHFTFLEGTAKWRLLTDALYVYEIFKPGQVTATEGNDLHQFIEEILEYATGKEPNQGYARTLRDLIPPTREENKLRAKATAIHNAMMEFLRLTDSTPEADFSPYIALSKELRENEAKQAELSLKTWPHAPMTSLKPPTSRQ